MILETPTLLVVQGREWAVDYYLTGPVQPDGKEPGITAYSDNPSSSFFYLCNNRVPAVYLVVQSML